MEFCSRAGVNLAHREAFAIPALFFDAAAGYYLRELWSASRGCLTGCEPRSVRLPLIDFQAMSRCDHKWAPFTGVSLSCQTTENSRALFVKEALVRLATNQMFASLTGWGRAGATAPLSPSLASLVTVAVDPPGRPVAPACGGSPTPLHCSAGRGFLCAGSKGAQPPCREIYLKPAQRVRQAKRVSAGCGRVTDPRRGRPPRLAKRADCGR